MEEKINIAELLKDCPKGMELDSTMYEDICFDFVDEMNMIHCFIQHENYKTSLTFNQHGTPNSNIKSKCVIFPKGKTTWEGFVPPYKFKDGDIVVTTLNNIAIIKEPIGTGYSVYAILFNNSLHTNTTKVGVARLVTEEEKQKLFDIIKANGYKWNTETKTLEKLIEPKFKVGDMIKHRLTGYVYRVLFIQSNAHSGGVYYHVGVTDKIEKSIDSKEQDSYELVSNKFDITTLKPFDKVLVRCNSLEKWHIQFFEKYNTESSAKYPFICLCNSKYCQCIPYEGNEHLLGKTDNCDDYYKTWEE